MSNQPIEKVGRHIELPDPTEFSVGDVRRHGNGKLYVRRDDPVRWEPVPEDVHKPFLTAGVLYSPGGDMTIKSPEPMAAIVVGLNPKVENEVHLQVFSLVTMFSRHNVPYDADGKPHSWRWPDNQ